MKRKLIHKLPNSLFVKLLIIIILTGICINIAVGIFFNHALTYSPQSPVQKYLNQYVNSIIKDLGSPPELQKAKDVARRSAIEILYESPDATWATSSEFPSSRRFYKSRYGANQTVHTIRHHGKIFISVNHDPGRFIFLLKPFVWQRDVRKKLVILLLALLTLILAGAYIAIKKTLKPVKDLTEAVHQIGSGNLKHRVNIDSTDELGKLATGFNHMTDRVQEMIKAKEQLLLDVSHELRSPLTRMKVALEKIPEGRTRENIKDDILEMERMVTELLEEARLRAKHGHLNVDDTDITELVRAMANLFADQKPGVEVIHAPLNVILSIDKERIKSVLNNVISNAVKYSAKSKKPVTINIEQKDGFTVVHIQDFGAGIPEEDMPHIFEPFYRVDKSRSKQTGGFGLGLSLCKTIMEAHNGRIDVDSGPGKGTKVSLYFPDSLKR